MKYRVIHKTAYLYSEAVMLCHNEVRLKPRSGARQTCRGTRLDVSPEPAVGAEYADFFGNHATFFTVQERHKKLEVSALSEVDVLPFSPPMPAFTPPWEDVRDGLVGENACRHFEAIQYVFDSPYVKSGEEFAAYAAPSFTPRRPVLEAAMDLTSRIHAEFEYDSRATNMHTSVSEVLEMRRGVCQDFAHLQLSCLRSLGLAARYVSGYLLTMPPPGKEKLIGSDASHAWISIYCPGFGWVDLDPTNDLVPSDKHVLLAFGRDYADVSPVKGVILGGGHHTIEVSVDVRPV